MSLDLERIAAWQSRGQGNENFEEQQRRLGQLFVLVLLIRGETLDDPVDQVLVDRDNVLWVETAEDGKLGPSDHECL